MQCLQQCKRNAEYGKAIDGPTARHHLEVQAGVLKTAKAGKTYR